MNRVLCVIIALWCCAALLWAESLRDNAYNKEEQRGEEA